MHASDFNLHSICISYFVLVYYLYEAVRMCAYFIYIVYIFFFYEKTKLHSKDGKNDVLDGSQYGESNGGNRFSIG